MYCDVLVVFYTQSLVLMLQYHISPTKHSTAGFVWVMESWKSHGFLFCKIKAFKSHGKLYFMENYYLSCNFLLNVFKHLKLRNSPDFCRNCFL